MKLHEYTPKNSYKRIGGILTVLIAVATGLFTVPVIFPNIPMQWIFHGSGILCLGIAIFIVCRYVLKKYVYAIEDRPTEEGFLPDLTVTEVTNNGKTAVTVCRFALSNIKAAKTFYPEDKESKREMKLFEAKAKTGGKPFFDYRPDMLSSPVMIISATEGGQDFVVKISPDETIISFVEKRGIGDI